MNHLTLWIIVVAAFVVLLSYVLSNLFFCWLSKQEEVDNLEEYYKNLHNDGE